MTITHYFVLFTFLSSCNSFEIPNARRFFNIVLSIVLSSTSSSFCIIQYHLAPAFVDVQLNDE